MPKKGIAEFANEEEERAFWETHDTTEYLDWSKAERIRFPNLKPTTKAIFITSGNPRALPGRQS